ncbi:MFS transporter [Caballeronia telluris]|uniref:Major facilitator transporter n=1 Tax=Caballeronia telluris TaxID=326475 RepID=A0A158GN98_9BURK|nr:MFS transporter [Caballeronia telluris]SAL33089.1 major facilitator transporter [Caballeronia telluris]
MIRSTATTGVLLAAILGSSMAFIDGTVVNVALAALQASLHATASQLQWVVEAYALTLASLLLLGGSLGDLYGRRKIFAAGVVIFAAASAWCGLAETVYTLITARAMQGIGAALLVPGSLSLISASFPAERRGRAIGTWSAFTAIMAAFGPVAGGWMIEQLSWRAVFFINLPLAAVVVWITLSGVPESRNDSMPQTLDWPGALLACAGLGCVTFALIEAARGGTVIATTAACGVVALILFVVVEARSTAPMMPLALFRSRTFAGANLITLFLYAAFGGTLYFLPLDLIQVEGYTATEAGAALLPLILLIFALSRWSGGLIASHGARLPLVVGPLIVAAGFAWLAASASTRAGASYWSTIFPPMFVLGLGMATCVAPLTTTVMNAVQLNDAGVASGVNNAVSRIAGLLAIAVFGVLLSVRFDSMLQEKLEALALSADMRNAVYMQRALLAGIHSGNPAVARAIDESFVSGYRLVLLIAATLAIASSASAYLLLPREDVAQKG